MKNNTKAGGADSTSQFSGSVSQRLEELGGKKVTGKQLERLCSAVDAGQTAARESMERREAREKQNATGEPSRKKA